MEIYKIKLIVDLTKAKIDILKLKADDYTWQCHIDEDTKKQLLEVLKQIDCQLIKIRGN